MKQPNACSTQVAGCKPIGHENLNVEVLVRVAIINIGGATQPLHKLANLPRAWESVMEVRIWHYNHSTNHSAK
eukprot:1600481-Amphidinium_carterae.1